MIFCISVLVLLSELLLVLRPSITIRTTIIAVIAITTLNRFPSDPCKPLGARSDWNTKR